MRKLNLKPYKARTNTIDGEKDLNYNVKNNIADLMTAAQLKLTGRDLITAGKVADKIENCKNDFILLEDNEFNHVKKVLDVTGLGRGFIPMLKRIEEAESVDASKINENEKADKSD